METPTKLETAAAILILSAFAWTCIALASAVGMARVDDCAIYCSEDQRTDFCCENCGN